VLRIYQKIRHGIKASPGSQQLLKKLKEKNIVEEFLQQSEAFNMAGICRVRFIVCLKVRVYLSSSEKVFLKYIVKFYIVLHSKEW